MNRGPGIFFNAFFAELEHRGVPYVVLHSYSAFPDKIDSDVDYAVRDSDVVKVHTILGEVADKTGWQIVQTLQYDIASYYSIIVDPAHPGTFLKLDRCSHYTRNGCFFIKDEILLADRRKFNGFYVPAISSEFIYTLAKVFAKGKPIAGYIPRLQELFAMEPRRSEELFHSVFGADQGRLADWFSRPPEEWNRLSAPMHARNRYGLAQRIQEWRRRVMRGLQPTGLSSIFFGANERDIGDVIKRLEQLLEPCFRKQMLLRFSKSGNDFKQWRAYRRSTNIMLSGSLEEFFQLRAWRSHSDFIFILPTNDKLQQQRLSELSANNSAVCLLNGSTSEELVQAAWIEMIKFLAAREKKRWGVPASTRA